MEKKNIETKPESMEGESILNENNEDLLFYLAGFIDELLAEAVKRAEGASEPDDEGSNENTDESVETPEPKIKDENEKTDQLGEAEMESKSSNWKMFKKEVKNFFCCFYCCKIPNTL